MKKGTTTASLLCENSVHAQGYKRIVGIDEAGRGTWAGPVFAAAVCLPVGQKNLTRMLSGVRDSKEMSPRQRESVVETVKTTAVAWGIGAADNHEVDQAGIVPATKLAMGRALDHLQAQFPAFQPDCLFLDALVWPEMFPRYPQISLIDGDARSLTIAAASVLAKVARDALMAETDAEYPQYGFAIHKGYGTARHLDALREFGPCPLHRLTFRPVRELIDQQP